jgi:hypothetical protein
LLVPLPESEEKERRPLLVCWHRRVDRNLYLQLSETLVVKRSLHDAVVFFPRRNFSNGQDIVPGLPESENNAKITAFIG